MEAAGLKNCSRCGRQGIAAATCPDCGAPTYTPAGEVRERAAAKASSLPLFVALGGAALVIGSLFATWYTLQVPPGLRAVFSGFASQLGQSFDRYAPGTSAQVNQGVSQVLRDGIDVDAWQAFKIVDIALVLAAGFALVLIGTLLVYGRSLERSAADVRRIVGMLGAVVIGATVYRMVNQPDPAEWFDLGPGPWLALIGGAAMSLASATGRVTRQTFE